MPEEDTKRSSNKGKNDPKEQRRKRQGRQHPPPVEKIVEKTEKNTPKVAEVAEKPAYEAPGPEFYQSLKRETDEILKITEEANSKYKKKEIQSNWAKYEMAIDTYEEIDEQENLGADYEALIQASFSVGGHFQFKHEKSWDVTTGPTPFDKYFEINMENLNIALSTIPFYERNTIDVTLFSDGDIQTMDHRATKFKQKYYNDKKYATPDMEAHEKILKNLTESAIESIETSNSDANNIKSNDLTVDILSDKSMLDSFSNDGDDKINKTDPIINPSKIRKENKLPIKHETEITSTSYKTTENKTLDRDIDIPEKDFIDVVASSKSKSDDVTFNQENLGNEIELPEAPKDYPLNLPKEPPKNPVIESPEDLEKWLDDFLDG